MSDEQKCWHKNVCDDDKHMTCRDCGELFTYVELISKKEQSPIDKTDVYGERVPICSHNYDPNANQILLHTYPAEPTVERPVAVPLAKCGKEQTCVKCGQRREHKNHDNTSTLSGYHIFQPEPPSEKVPDDISLEEAAGIAAGLEDFAAGRTRLLADIEAEPQQVTVREDLRELYDLAKCGAFATLNKKIVSAIERLGAAEQRAGQVERRLGDSARMEWERLDKTNKELAEYAQHLEAERDRLKNQFAVSEQLRFAAEHEIDDALDAIVAGEEKRDDVLSHQVRAKVAELEGKLEKAERQRDLWGNAVKQGICPACSHPINRHGIGKYSGEPKCFDCEGVGQIMCSEVTKTAAAHDAQVRREALQRAADAIGSILNHGGELEFRDGLAEAQCAVLTLIESKLPDYDPQPSIEANSKAVRALRDKL